MNFLSAKDDSQNSSKFAATEKDFINLARRVEDNGPISTNLKQKLKETIQRKKVETARRKKKISAQPQTQVNMS